MFTSSYAFTADCTDFNTCIHVYPGKLLFILTKIASTYGTLQSEMPYKTMSYS